MKGPFVCYVIVMLWGWVCSVHAIQHYESYGPMLLALWGGVGCQISREKMLRITWMAPTGLDTTEVTYSSMQCSKSRWEVEGQLMTTSEHWNNTFIRGAQLKYGDHRWKNNCILIRYPFLYATNCLGCVADGFANFRICLLLVLSMAFKVTVWH